MESRFNLRTFPLSDVLDILVEDKSTNRNIVWGTNSYSDLGEEYGSRVNISVFSLLKNPNIIQPSVCKSLNFKNERKRNHGEVFTPTWVVNSMVTAMDQLAFKDISKFNIITSCNSWVDILEKISFANRTKWQDYVKFKICEITCGEAPFLASRYDTSNGNDIELVHRVGVLDRKIRIINENTFSFKQWFYWIKVAFQSCYGYEMQGDNLLIARINLLLTFFDYYCVKWNKEPDSHELRIIADIISWNIWQMDGLTECVPGEEESKDSVQLSLDLFGLNEILYNETSFCKIYNWENKEVYLFKNLGARNMESKFFDFIIGNPPYQEMRKGDSNTATPVYHLFMSSAYNISNKVLLITPARYLFNTGYTPKVWNNQRLNDPHFKVLKYYDNASEIFKNVDIKGGVAISYRDTTQFFGAIEIFTTNNVLNRIIKKVKSRPDFIALSEIIITSFAYHFTNQLYKDHPNLFGRASKGHEFDLQSNTFITLKEVFLDVRPKQGDYVRILGREDNQRAWKFIRRCYINSVENLDFYKVFISKATGTGQFGETLPEMIIGSPGDGATSTFLSIGSFSSVEECKACEKYLKTKFARALLSTLKATQNASKPVYRLIPLQNFSNLSDINWKSSISDIDKQLFKKYKLNEEEIDFIEKNVKEMR